MFSQSKTQATSEQFETLAETLADFLVSGGDHVGANQVLSVVSRRPIRQPLLRRANIIWLITTLPVRSQP